VDRTKPKEIEVKLKPKSTNKELIQLPIETEKESEKRTIEEFFNYCGECAKDKNKGKIKIEEQTKMKLPREPKPPTAKQKIELFAIEENKIIETQANITETKQEEVIKSKNNNIIEAGEEATKEKDKELIPKITQELIKEQDNKTEKEWIQQREAERKKELEAIIEIK
jgi:hypothetical protein